MYSGTAGQSQSAGHEPLPISLDGGATWLTARSGNGVFETNAVTSAGTAWIDAGRVTDPAAITGSTYSIQFSTNAGQVSYSVLRDGAATAQTGVPYEAGKAITIDGMAVTVSGTPAAGDQFALTPSTSTLSVFDVLDRAVAQLSTSNRSATQRTQDTVFQLRDIDQGMQRLSTARSEVGGVLNRIDGVTDRMEGQKLAGVSERSNAEDLDMLQAVSDFQTKQSGYDAALKSYAMVQRLSLFQYLNQ
jgi:flagellar hook-associated protein 3 FlgL